MIPAGYVNSIVQWAKRPDLSTEEKTARQTQLLDEHDTLVAGQLGGKPSRTLIQGGLNGKSFAWSPDITTAEKAVVITEVLAALGLLDPAGARVHLTYGAFAALQR